MECFFEPSCSPLAPPTNWLSCGCERLAASEFFSSPGLGLFSGRSNYRYHLDHRYRINWSRTDFPGSVRYRWSR